MKCFSCGKNFDYEKYYGICPKCGCYNKKTVESENPQHAYKEQESVRMHERKIKRKRLSTSSRLLFILGLILLFLIFGSTPISLLYENIVVSKIQRDHSVCLVWRMDHGGQLSVLSDIGASVSCQLSDIHRDRLVFIGIVCISHQQKMGVCLTGKHPETDHSGSGFLFRKPCLLRCM